MLNLGWLDIDRYDDACPKCDRETFLDLEYRFAREDLGITPATATLDDFI